MPTTDTTVGRLKLVHPDLGHDGGAALHTKVRNGWTKIGDMMNSRFFTVDGLADTASQDFEHNFKVAFGEVRWILYLRDTGTGELTRIDSGSTPPVSDFTVVATPGFLTTQIRVTNNSGSARDLALVVVHGRGSEQLNDLDDVDLTTPPEDGQALVWDGSTFVPGASGDSSFKLQSITDPNAVIKGGIYKLDSGITLVTYDGVTYGADISPNLDTVLGGNPTDATVYSLYVDRLLLGAPVTIASGKYKGLTATPVLSTNLHLSTTQPESKNPSRYVPIGWIRSADTGTVWSGTGAAFGTFAQRSHDTVAAFISQTEEKIYSVTTAVASNITAHGLTAEPQLINIYYFDGTKKIGLDLSAHLVDVDDTNIEISTLGLTFGGGQYVEVVAFHIPSLAGNVVSLQHAFTSGWMSTTAITSLAHNLNDKADVRGYEVQEYDVLNNRIRNIDRSALVKWFTDTTFELNWTGLLPTADLLYRVVAGGTPIPSTLPVEFGGFNKFVGFGPGSYQTLAAAIAGASPGDSILVAKSHSISGDINVNVSNIRIRSMPGVVVTQTGTLTNGFRITAAGVVLEKMHVKQQSLAGWARGYSFEALHCTADHCVLELDTAQTLAVGVYAQTAANGAMGKIRIVKNGNPLTASANITAVSLLDVLTI